MYKQEPPLITWLFQHWAADAPQPATRLRTSARRRAWRAQSTVNHHWHTDVSWLKSVPFGHRKENIFWLPHTWYTWQEVSGSANIMLAMAELQVKPVTGMLVWIG